jgi:hypothetical protein
MSAAQVEVEKAHTEHLVETETTTARKRVVLRASSGHNLLVLAEVHRGTRAWFCVGIEREGYMD